MAKPKKDDETKVWTNVSANPVILSDGSTVAPGEATTDAQAALVPGSCWEEWRVLVPGSAEQSLAAEMQIDDLRQENEALRQRVVDLNSAGGDYREEIGSLKREIEALKAQIKPAE
ncbi:MAG: hypothetical protein ACTMIS_04870 [Pseudomonas putida]